MAMLRVFALALVALCCISAVKGMEVDFDIDDTFDKALLMSTSESVGAKAKSQAKWSQSVLRQLRLYNEKQAAADSQKSKWTHAVNTLNTYRSERDSADKMKKNSYQNYTAEVEVHKQTVANHTAAIAELGRVRGILVSYHGKAREWQLKHHKLVHETNVAAHHLAHAKRVTSVYQRDYIAAKNYYDKIRGIFFKRCKQHISLTELDLLYTKNGDDTPKKPIVLTNNATALASTNDAITATQGHKGRWGFRRRRIARRRRRIRRRRHRPRRRAPRRVRRIIRGRGRWWHWRHKRRQAARRAAARRRARARQRRLRHRRWGIRRSNRIRARRARRAKQRAARAKWRRIHAARRARRRARIRAARLRFQRAHARLRAMRRRLAMLRRRHARRKRIRAARLAAQRARARDHKRKRLLAFLKAQARRRAAARRRHQAKQVKWKNANHRAPRLPPRTVPKRKTNVVTTATGKAVPVAPRPVPPPRKRPTPPKPKPLPPPKPTRPPFWIWCRMGGPGRTAVNTWRIKTMTKKAKYEKHALSVRHWSDKRTKLHGETLSAHAHFKQWQMRIRILENGLYAKKVAIEKEKRAVRIKQMAKVKLSLKHYYRRLRAYNLWIARYNAQTKRAEHEHKLLAAKAKTADDHKKLYEAAKAHYLRAELCDTADAKTTDPAPGDLERLWVRPPGAPQAVDIAVNNWDQVFVCRSGTHTLMNYEPETQTWHAVKGAPSCVHVSLDCAGIPYVIGRDARVYRHSSTKHGHWEAITPKGAKYTSVGASTQEKVFAVDTSGQLVTRDIYTGQWNKYKVPEALAAVTVTCKGDVWVLSKKSVLYHLIDKEHATWRAKGKNVARVTSGNNRVIAIGKNKVVVEYLPAVSGEGADSKDHHWFRWKAKMQQLSAGPDGTIWGVNEQGQVVKHLVKDHELSSPEQAYWQYKRGGVWEELPHSRRVTQIEFGTKNMGIWGTTAQPYQLLSYNAETRKWSPWPMANLKSVSFSPTTDQDVWGINSQDDPVKFNRETQQFELIKDAKAQKLSAITVCGDGHVWGLDKKAGFIVKWWPEKKKWYVEDVNPAEGHDDLSSNIKMNSLSCGWDGTLVAADKSGQIWFKEHSHRVYQPWERAKNKRAARKVYVGNNVFIIDSQNNLYQYNLRPMVGHKYGPTQPWVNMHKKLKSIAADASGDLVGIDLFNHVVKFVPTRHASSKPSWVRVAGNLTHIDVGDANSVWGLGADGIPMKYDHEVESWTIFHAPALRQISVGCDQTVWGVTSNQTSTYDMEAAITDDSSDDEDYDLLFDDINANGPDGIPEVVGRAGPEFDFDANVPVKQQTSHDNNVVKDANKAKSNAGRVVRLAPGDDGERWQEVPYSEHIAKVAVGSREQVWGLTYSGHPVQYSMRSRRWNKIMGHRVFRDITHGCGADEVYGITKEDVVYKYDARTGGWSKIIDGIAQVAAGSDLYVLDKTHVVSRYDKEVKGVHWAKLGQTTAAPVLELAAGARDALWALDSRGRPIIISPGEVEKGATDDGTPRTGLAWDAGLQSADSYADDYGLEQEKNNQKPAPAAPLPNFEKAQVQIVDAIGDPQE